VGLYLRIQLDTKGALMGIKGFTPEELKEVRDALIVQRIVLRGHLFPYTGIPKNKLTLEERQEIEENMARLADVSSALDCVTEQIRRDEELTRRAEEDLITHAAMMRRMTEDSTKLETMEDAKDYIDKVSKRK
jgi:hypothetical protein